MLQQLETQISKQDELLNGALFLAPKMRISALMQPSLGLLLLAAIAAFACGVVVVDALEKNAAKNNAMRTQLQPISGPQKWAKFTSVSLRCTREDNSVYKWCATLFYGRMPIHCELVRVGCN